MGTLHVCIPYNSAFIAISIHHTGPTMSVFHSIGNSLARNGFRACPGPDLEASLDLRPEVLKIKPVWCAITMMEFGKTQFF